VLLEHPFALDVAASGRVVVLDRGGRRLCFLDGAGALDLGFEARRCRFRGEDLVLLGAAGDLVTLARDGAPLGAARVREGPLDLAVLPGGSVVVSYGRRGGHGVTLERFGAVPLVLRDPALLDAACLAAESGGFWVAGTGAEAPTARAVRFLPVPSGLEARAVVALPSPPRAAAVGPDGELYVLLEPGESLVRVHAGRAGPALRVPGPLHALARHGRRLLGCGPRGLEELTRLVPRPEGDLQPPALPPCSA
jgi:hypothetical protein